MSAEVKQPVKRRVAKGVRRKQLIEATLDVIAKRGLGDTTLSLVSKAAGLSQGIVNLHFTSKENLLNEALAFLRDEYENAWRSALEGAGDHPAERLAALLKIDYQARVADRKRLAVWFAFWGEVKVRPAYRQICQERVDVYTQVLGELVQDLHDVNKPIAAPASEMAETIIALADGLWLNMLVSGRELSRAKAEQLMMSFMARTYPAFADYFTK